MAVLDFPEPDKMRAFERALEQRYDDEFSGLRLWEGHRGWWLQDMGAGHEARILASLERFDQIVGWRGKRCLDMGCGSAASLIALEALGAHAVGIDKELAGADIALAQLRAAMYGMNIDVRKGDATRLEFPDAAFDVVLSTSVAEHVEDIAVYFSEAARVLKPGGVFLLMTDNRASLREAHTRLWFAHWLPHRAFRALGNAKLGLPRKTALAVYPRTYSYYRRLGRRCGFRPVAGHLDSVIWAAPDEVSAAKRQVASLLRSVRMPVEAVAPGTLIVFRKDAPQDVTHE
jgi:2-polyprenyl-3-methyl-5-hydroxy-6-metoxy-1,4-benzoquinol methylase